jgi:hypothetical protein
MRGPAMYQGQGSTRFIEEAVHMVWLDIQLVSCVVPGGFDKGMVKHCTPLVVSDSTSIITT